MIQTIFLHKFGNGLEKTDLNQPTSGARYEHALPVGKHPLQLYSLATPNGQKVTILLEELLALGHQDAEYDAWLIKIGEGQQFGSGFVEINPNSKIPALVDHSQNPPLRVFESGSILLYLAEKFKAFIPTDIAARTECLNWLFWQMGSAPYLGGGLDILCLCPVKIEYAINRFAMETKRLLDVLDQHLAKTNIWLVLNIASLILQRSLGMAVLLKTGYITARSFRCRSI